MKKRTLSLVLALSLLLSLIPSGIFAAEHQITSFGNEFEIDSAADWQTGDLDNDKLVVDNTVGGGSISLKDGETEAVYTSADITMPDFDYLVMSWNADAPEGTWIEVTASVHRPSLSIWSDFKSWGKWSPFIKHASQPYVSADPVRMASDEMEISGSPSSHTAADGVRLKVTLHRDSAETESPVLWYLHGTVCDSEADNPVKVFRDSLTDAQLATETCEVEVPQYSQILRAPTMAGVMCNPTTTSMLLNSVSAMGGAPLNLLPEEVAMGCFDFRNNSFGNWSYVMAAAGSYGYRSYVDYSTIEGIKRHLLSGYAVGASVAYSTDPSAPNYLENAYGSTPGHLIVLRGFTKIDGVEYFISNDPYNPTNAAVRKLYRVDQFVHAWSGNTIYIVKPGKVDGVGNHPVERVNADLVETSAGKYTLKRTDTGAIITIPQANSAFNNLHGFIGYTTQDEAFDGANAKTYI